jgi:hypothetical protein
LIPVSSHYFASVVALYMMVFSERFDVYGSLTDGPSACESSEEAP